jgi:membrane protein implicated in regulation of membrane protease activity
MVPAVWWIITAVVFFILEMATASFFFLWIGAGAVLTALTSLFVDKDWIQYTVFAVSSILLVVLSRPWAKRFSGKNIRFSNVDALIGQTGSVTKVQRDFTWQGYIKVGGEMWKVESENKVPLTLEGNVVVLEARSNVLVVKVQ